MTTILLWNANCLSKELFSAGVNKIEILLFFRMEILMAFPGIFSTGVCTEINVLFSVFKFNPHKTQKYV